MAYSFLLETIFLLYRNHRVNGSRPRPARPRGRLGTELARLSQHAPKPCTVVSVLQRFEEAERGRSGATRDDVGVVSDRAHWVFELPHDASDALVAYHDVAMRHHVEMAAARAALTSAWELVQSAGVHDQAELPADHPARVRIEEAMAQDARLRARYEAANQAAENALSEAELARYRALHAAWCFSDANAQRPEEHVSPSGRYRLRVTIHETSPGKWSYSQGTVFRAGVDVPLAVVERNFGAFPFEWIEGHTNGHDYLICGSDYQGQTFIELDTGARRDALSDGAGEGIGFCWASYWRLAETQILVVDGCYWACPYELRFFDISDPMRGWPELTLPEGIAWPEPEDSVVTATADGIVWVEERQRFVETGEHDTVLAERRDALWEDARRLEHQRASEAAIAVAKRALDDHDERYGQGPRVAPASWERVVVRRLELRRADRALILVSDWKSDWLAARERRLEEREEREDAERRAWRDGDELLQLIEREYSSESYSLSFSYPSRVMQWDGDPNPCYIQVDIKPEETSGDRRSARLRWGVEDGPITLELTDRRPRMFEREELPRTPEGLERAWVAARRYMNGASR